MLLQAGVVLPQFSWRGVARLFLGSDGLSLTMNVMEN